METQYSLPRTQYGFPVKALAGPILPRIILINHGLKTGGLTVPKASCYLDARGLPDGARNPMARDYNWVRAQVDLRPYVDIFEAGYGMLSSRREISRMAEPFVVCCLCAYGRNRSVMLKQLMAERLEQLGYQVEVR